MNVIVIFLILIIVYYGYQNLYNNFNENFLVVGYNNPLILDYKIHNLFDDETVVLDTQFFDASIDKNFDTKNYILFNTNLPFPFTNQFQKLLLSFLKTIPRISNNKISLGDFNNIIYKNTADGSDRIFILNVNIQDNTKFTSRNIKVKFVVSQINLFLDPINYLSSFNPKLMNDNCKLTGVKLDKNGYAKFNMKGVDKLNPNFYLIDNTLHLLDPFVTVGSDMIITKEMKEAFDISLAQHQDKSNSKKFSNSVGSN